MAESKLSIFNKRNTLLDNLYGLPGANELLRYKLLEYMARMAKSKTYFSNTTYSIIYKLIQSKKIGLFFIPYIRGSKFFVSNVPIQVVGGYDFNLRRIEIMVKWSFGVDAISQLFESHIPLICNKVIALILSEALLIYNYKHNGELTNKNENIKKWYQIYFEGVIGDTIHRYDLAKNLSKIISENYPSRIFNSVEKPIIEGRSPSVIIDKKGENAELDIEGISSIKKGDKELEDIFGDCIEDYINANRETFNIDNEAFKDLKTLVDEFGNFGSFLYKNRDLYLDPANLEDMPDDAFENLNKDQLSAAAKQATLHKLEVENQKKEEEEYQNYVNSNPKIKEALEKSRNDEWDKRAEKYFGEFKNKIDESTGKLIHKGKYASLVGYINDKDPKDNYIRTYMIESGQASADDVQDAIDGTRQSIEMYRQMQRRYIEVSHNPNSTEKQKKDALVAMRAYETQASELFKSLRDLYSNLLVDKRVMQEFSTDFKNGGLVTLRRMGDVLNDAKKAEKRKSEKVVDPLRGTDSEALLPRLSGVERNPPKNIEKFLDGKKALLLDLKNRIEMNIELAKTGDRHANHEVYRLGAQLRNEMINFGQSGRSLLTVVSDKTDEEIRKGLESIDWKQRHEQDRQIQYDINNIYSARSNIFHKTNFFNQNTYENFRKIYFNGNNIKSFDEFDSKNFTTHLSNLIVRFNRKKDYLEREEKVFNTTPPSSSIAPGIDHQRKWFKNEKGNLDRAVDYTSSPQTNGVPFKISSTNIDEIRKSLNNYILSEVVKRKERDIRKTSETVLREVQREIYDRFFKGLINADNTIHSTVLNYERAVIEDNIRKKIRGEDGKVIDIRGLSANNIKNFESLYKSSAYSPELERVKKLLNSTGGIKAYKQREAYKKILEGLKNGRDIGSIDPTGLGLDNDQFNEIKKLLSNVDPAIQITTILYLGNNVMNLSPKSKLTPQKGYTRTLFLNGLGYMIDCLPDWDTIKYHARNIKNKSIDLYYMLRSIYRFVKLILPLKSNIERYTHQKFGYGTIASYKYFDLAYKITFKLKKMYELNKGSIRRDMTYSEIFMPTTIFKKALYSHLVTQNDYTPEILYLINCANKGLEEFM